MQETGVEAVVLEQLFDTAQQIGLAQLGAGKVDRQWAGTVVQPVPFGHLPAGGFQDPVADLQDHAVFFSQRDEVFPRHVAKGRMAPADQGFGADQAVVHEADFRLVAQVQLVAFDGAAQFVFQRHAFAGLGGEVAGVAFDAVAALGLGAVHRGVGVLDQCGNVAAILRIEAGADTGADEKLVFAGLERRGETIEQFGGDVVGIAGLLQARQQNDEFVTPQARHGVDVTQLLLEAHGNALEQQVADRVAEAVVDVFEAVKVEEQHGALATVFLLVVERRQQTAFEQRAVRQAGQRVVVCLVVEFGLGVLEAGNVGEHRDKVGDEVLPVAHGTDGQPAWIQLAILASVGNLALPVAFGGQLMPHGRVERAVMQA
ncbi:hypothetical protein D3C87_1227960 [compost metagenome]